MHSFQEKKVLRTLKSEQASPLLKLIIKFHRDLKRNAPNHILDPEIPKNSASPQYCIQKSRSNETTVFYDRYNRSAH